MAHIEQALDTGLNLNINYPAYAEDFFNPDDPKYFTPLALAASEEYLDACKLLLLRGADPQGSTHMHLPLLEATDNQDYTLAKLLLDYGADVNACDETDCTPLMAASLNNDYTSCELLLQHGADLNAMDPNEGSSLTIASSAGYYDIAKLLLNHHARLDLLDSEGYTALEIALLEHHWTLSKLLLSYGAALPQDLQSDDPRALRLVEKYQRFDQSIHALSTVPALIAFLRKNHRMGNIPLIQRTLALKLGTWAYPRRLFESLEEVQPFYDHLHYFAEWIQANPGIVSQARVEETQVLAFFAQYLSELAQQQPLSKLKMDIREGLEQSWGQKVPEISNYIWGLSNLGIAIPFHRDLVKHQAALLKRLEKQAPNFKKELSQKPAYRTLIWSQTPFVRRAIQAFDDEASAKAQPSNRNTLRPSA